MSTTDHRQPPAVRTPARRLAPLAFGLVILVAACGSNTSTPTASTVEAGQSPPTGSSPSATPSSMSVPSSPSLGPSASTATQTDTDWGRIWDAVPAGFPRFPGATSAGDATPEPVSAAYAVNGTDAGEIATWMQSALESATYSTEALSGPLEDGGYVLDSVGDAGCRLETRITPQGNLVIVTVRYGAGCPAP